MSMPVLAPMQVSRPRGLTLLPTPIFLRILDDLPAVDLYSLAQVSRACYQAIQRDDLWIPKLTRLNLWSPRSNPTHVSTKSVTSPRDDSFTPIPISGAPASNNVLAPSGRRKNSHDLKNGLPLLSPDPIGLEPRRQIEEEFQDSPLDILESVDRFVSPGNARRIFTRLFKALYPYYHDIIQSGTHAEPAIFRMYRDPVDQAKILAQLKVFVKCDPAETDHYENLDKLTSVYEVFENAALGEFETGFDENDIEGRVKKFAKVLVTLNGGDSCVQLFIQKNQLVNDRSEDPVDYLDQETGKLDTKKLQAMLRSISDGINKEVKVIDSIFPPTAQVLRGLCQHIIEENISDLFISIITAAKERDIKNYLEAVPFLYVYFMWFLESLKPPPETEREFKRTLREQFLNIYDIYIDTYLEDECTEFSRYARSQVVQWDKEARDAEVAIETLLLSNVSKAKDKKDILASFKKVLMMPVSVIPFNISGISSNNNTPAVQISATPSTTSIPDQVRIPTNDSVTSLAGSFSSGEMKRSTTPIALARGISSSGNNHSKDSTTFMKRASILPSTLPTTEFDARMAVMTNRLEGINTLISLELALNIIRAGRDAIERAGKFVSAGGDIGQEAKDHCETIFVELVQTVGGVHIRGGFEKALETLEKYDSTSLQKLVTIPGSNGKEDHEHNAVEPLAIFAELVNIGDLIQQMVHVFFEEELAIRRFIDRNSFVSPAIKEKRGFEKMLDSYVANGLSKGIDVLVNQIDYIFLMEQKSSDYFPGIVSETGAALTPAAAAAAATEAASKKNNRRSVIFKSTSDYDMSPTLAARKVVNLLKLHTGLLAGSTDRTVIDVFQQEVGVRFFGSLCKHIKHQVISVDGSVKLLLDLNSYYDFILTLRQQPVTPYFAALKEVGQMYLIDGKDAKELGKMLSDMSRFGDIFQPEEVFEFAQRREDWLRVKKEVEKVMYGFGAADCSIM